MGLSQRVQNSLESLRIVNILLDLKCKVKRGDQSPIIERHWQRCKVALDDIPIPALVQNLASVHNACPAYWVLDTMHGALHQFLQVVDRANGKQRVQTGWSARFLESLQATQTSATASYCGIIGLGYH